MPRGLAVILSLDFLAAQENPDDLLDVVFGRVYVWAVISFEEIRRQLEAVGVAVELEPEDSEWMLKLTHDYNGEPAISKIGTHLMHRLVAEFASLKWLVHELSVLPEMPALEDGGAQDGTAALGSTIDLEERGTDREVTAGSAPGRVGDSRRSNTAKILMYVGW